MTNNEEEKKKKEEQTVNNTAEPVADAAGAGAGISISEVQMNPKKQSFEVAGTGSEKLGVSNYADNTNINGGQQFYVPTPDVKVDGTDLYNEPEVSEYEKMRRDLQAAYDADNKELQKQRKSQEAIGSISDAINAMTNMYFSAKGAPSIAQDPTQTMSAKARERYDKAKVELDRSNASNLQYINDLAANKRADISHKQADERLAIAKDEHDRKLKTDEFNRDYKTFMGNLQQERFEYEKEYKIKKLTLDELNAKSRELQAKASQWRAKHGGSNMPDYTVETNYERDALGNIVKITKQRTVDGVAYEVSRETIGNDGGSSNNGRSTADLGSSSNNKKSKETAAL